MSVSLWEVDDGTGSDGDLLLTSFFHITKEQRKPIYNMEKKEMMQIRLLRARWEQLLGSLGFFIYILNNYI